MARTTSIKRRVGKGAPRFPPGAVMKMRQMRREGKSIDEIAEAFGTGKSTVWPHVHDLKVGDGKGTPDSPVETERRVAQKAELEQSAATVPPAPPRPVVTVASQVEIEPELVGILAGLALKAGYPSLSEYLRKEGIDWLLTIKETKEDQFNSYKEATEAYKEIFALKTALVKTRRLLLSRKGQEVDRRRERRDFVELMALEGHKPDEIERIVSQLERLDPPSTKGDPSAPVWTLPVRPALRPLAPPPLVIEETPMPRNIKPLRPDSELHKQSMPEEQPSQEAVLKQSPDEASSTRKQTAQPDQQQE